MYIGDLAIEYGDVLVYEPVPGVINRASSPALEPSFATAPILIAVLFEKNHQGSDHGSQTILTESTANINCPAMGLAFTNRFLEKIRNAVDVARQ